MPSLVRAATLTSYLDVTRLLRINPVTLLRQAGLSRALIALPDQMIPANAVVKLLESTADASGCQTIGLQMAQSRSIADFGAISLVIAHQPTLRDALQIMIDYRHLLNETLMLLIEESGDQVIIREEIAIGEGLAARQASELALAILFRLCEAVLGPHWQPQSAHFIHDAPAELDLHRRTFRCRLAFGSEFNGLVFSARDLDRPIPLANPALATHALDMLGRLTDSPRRSVRDDVCQSISFLLPTGRASIATVAQALGLTVRTLQRRLDAEGEQFGTLVTLVRREAALRYLANPHFKLVHISELLGYASQGAFSRWFLASFGVQPSKFADHQGLKR